MKPFTAITAILFALGTAAHALRLLVFHFEFRVGDVMLPLWGSLPAMLVAGIFSWMLWREAHA